MEYKTINISATLTEKQLVTGSKAYLCTFRGKPLLCANKYVKFECAPDTKLEDIFKFFKEEELEELTIKFPV